MSGRCVSRWTGDYTAEVSVSYVRCILLLESVNILKTQATCRLCVSMKIKSKNKEGGKQHLREVMHSCDVSSGRAL